MSFIRPLWIALWVRTTAFLRREEGQTTAEYALVILAAAIIAEEAFEYLDGPIMRITAPDTPVPYSPPLEEFFLPKTSDIIRVARQLAAY